MTGVSAVIEPQPWVREREIYPLPAMAVRMCDSAR